MQGRCNIYIKHAVVALTIRVITPSLVTNAFGLLKAILAKPPYSHRNPVLSPFLDDRPEGNVIFMAMVHVGGLCSLIISITFGKTLVLMPRFDFKQYLELIVKYRVSADNNYSTCTLYTIQDEAT